MKRQTLELFEDRMEASLPLLGQDGTWQKPDKSSLAYLVSSLEAASPYLGGLVKKWPNLVKALREHSPEQLYEDILKDMRAEDLTQAQLLIRQAKQKIHLLLCLCDVADIWDEMTVCQYLSGFADAAMHEFIRHLACEMEFSGDEENPVPGLFVLALGKYGARELNYSSDIDLVVMYDPERLILPNPAKAQKTLIRFVRRLMRSFDEITPDGYVFRTDLRLRPDPRATTIAVSTRTAERYYEALGQNWERAAMIKARVVGGDRQAGQDFIDTVLGPFIWRRSLDFHAIDDIHSIKRQIRDKAGADDFVAPGHDLKLGLGGIREIEFFVQVQQLILGGRHPDLRCLQTLDALQALAEKGFAGGDDVAQLQTAYRFLRRVEHRIQMYQDAQTHSWPESPEERQYLAVLCGYLSPEPIECALQDTFRAVHAIYSALFAGEESLSAEQGSLVFTGISPEPQTLATLEKYGFDRGPDIWRLMADWLGGRIAATRSPRARELLTRLAPRLIEACGQSGTPDAAFLGFGQFIGGLNAGVNVFSLLLRRPQVLQALIDMMAMVPQLADQFANQPGVLDVLTDPDFMQGRQGGQSCNYLHLVAGDVDFETGMNLVRKAQNENCLGFISGFLGGHISDRAGEILSDMAEAAIQAMLELARKEVERKTGPLNGEYAVLALGKLGGREMTLRSDVDVMLVFEDPGGVQHKAYSQLTRRFVTALSSVTAEGRLYEVDMALRPSGRAGPLAVSLDAFETYYRHSAWTWEFMALGRGRAVAGSSPEFLQRLEAFRLSLLKTKNYGGQLRRDILDMHARLKREKTDYGIWDIKNTRGGLRDIEFIAQYCLLKTVPDTAPRSTVDMIASARKVGCLSREQARILREAVQVFALVQQVLAVADEQPQAGRDLHLTTQNLLVSKTSAIDFTKFTKQLTTIQAQVKRVFTDVFGL